MFGGTITGSEPDDSGGRALLEEDLHKIIVLRQNHVKALLSRKLKNLDIVGIHQIKRFDMGGFREICGNAGNEPERNVLVNEDFHGSGVTRPRKCAVGA